MPTTTNQKLTADVAVARHLPTTYTYAIPEEWSGLVHSGTRVQVPLGGQQVGGVVLSTGPAAPGAPATLKYLSQLIEPDCPLPGELIKLAEWVSSYYLCSIGEAANAVAGHVAVRGEPEYRLCLPDWDTNAEALRDLSRTEAGVCASLSSHKAVTRSQLMKAGFTARQITTALCRLRARGILDTHWRTRRPPVPTDASILGRNRDKNDLDKDAADVLRGIEDSGGVLWTELSAIFPGGRKALRERMLGESLEWDPAPGASGRAFRDIAKAEPELDALDADQRSAVARIAEGLAAGSFGVSLLWGPTGSGKTAVYCAAIREAWRQGRRALLLVPEIGLAGPMMARLRATLNEPIGVWHSALTSSQRYWISRRVHQGRYRLVVGARSAIFAPIPDLGLIIVDEEHSESYKQSDPAPRYHARDVAVMRAKLNQAVCVLGSATPSCESYSNATDGKYELLRLTRRARGRRMPLVQIVDLSKKRIAEEGDWVSPTMRDALIETVRAGNKAIVFINRRGYATMVACQECGHHLECPNCSLTLTYHSTDRRFHCHLCTYSQPATQKCPNCAGTEFLFRGAGTQRIEETLSQLDSSIRLVRLDADIAARRGAAEEILSGFAGGRYNVLLGTQMVAKGLDVTRVGLVGVIWADQHMAFPDFRAEERTFQLLTQVAGRAGRDADSESVGRVLVQSFRPEHDLIELAAAQDATLFFERELPRREELDYPPFAHLVLLAFAGPERDAVRTTAQSFVAFWKESVGQPRKEPGKLLGPSPAAIGRRAGEYLYHVLIKAHAFKAVRDLVGAFDRQLQSSRRTPETRLIVDVDPVDFW